VSITLSVLELGRVRQGGTRRDALDEARRLARHVESLGYRRIWVAEHHNMPAVTTAATSLVVAHLAAGTTTIRVGAGGIMLPNHAPYVIAEQFGTLATLFPGRIDLGVGRLPADAEHFPQDVLELQAFLAPVAPGQRIEAVPGSGTEVPIYILGSSLFGAQLAAELGLPFGFASHFSPQQLDAALAIYRGRFKPSAQLAAPHAMVGVNVIAAGTDAEARRLATTQQMSFTNILRAARALTQPPIDDIDAYWLPHEKFRASQMLACSVVGSIETVRRGLDRLVERTQADELIVVSDVYDFDTRLRSFELIAQAAAGVSNRSSMQA
jgi:luciferase family oxidoreductase group 1